MKTKNHILLAFAAVIMMAVCIVSCARRQEVERYGTGVDVITKERPLGKWTVCRVCSGKGVCINCKGTGKVNEKECNSCKGTGRCSTCEGQGGFRTTE